MPDPDLDLVAQRIPTVLGPLEVALPAGAALRNDPGAAEGSVRYWTPPAGGAVLTVSAGEAEQRTAASLLALEGSLDNTTVTVLRDEAGAATGEHHLEFLARPTAARTFTADGAGHGHAHAGDREPASRARFRFWQHGGSAVRLGYRLDDSAAADWRAVLDRILDSARLG